MSDHILTKAQQGKSFAKIVKTSTGDNQLSTLARGCMEFADCIELLRAEQLKIEKYISKMLKEEKKKKEI